MKTILVLFSTLIFTMNPLLNTSNTSEVLTEELTFDAYEGEYFFFTNCNDESIILAMDSKSDDNIKLLTSNEVAGESFKVHYKHSEKTENSSSEGIILYFESVK